MGKTFRRMNSKSNHFYKDDWKRLYRYDSDPTYTKEFIVKNDDESRKERSYFHTDLLKPSSSKLLRLAKKQSNRLSRNKSRIDTDKINKIHLNDIGDFIESNPKIYRLNKYKWIWVY